MSSRRLAVLGVVLVPAACGVTRMQTARTVPRGETQTTWAASLVHEGDRGISANGIPLVPVDVMVRHGDTDRVNWGIRLFDGLGLLGDVK